MPERPRTASEEHPRAIGWYDPGIKEGTIYRPTDLGGAEKYPIFVWGNGACSQDGLSNTAAMAEIASHGYFVVADGTPKGSGGRSQTSNWVAMGKPLLAYVSWAIAENGKSCSAYQAVFPQLVPILAERCA
jgi:hypothetical protein